MLDMSMDPFKPTDEAEDQEKSEKEKEREATKRKFKEMRARSSKESRWATQAGCKMIIKDLFEKLNWKKWTICLSTIYAGAFFSCATFNFSLMETQIMFTLGTLFMVRTRIQYDVLPWLLIVVFHSIALNRVWLFSSFILSSPLLSSPRFSHRLLCLVHCTTGSITNVWLCSLELSQLPC